MVSPEVVAVVVCERTGSVEVRCVLLAVLSSYVCVVLCRGVLYSKCLVYVLMVGPDVEWIKKH